MKTLYKLSSCGDSIYVKKAFIGYKIYDGDIYAGWRLTLGAAKRFGAYLGGF